MKIEGLVVQLEHQNLSLYGQESHEVFVTVTGGQAVPDSNYKLTDVIPPEKKGHLQ